MRNAITEPVWNKYLLTPPKRISADSLFERIPVLAISGDDSAVDLILDQVLRLLLSQIRGDIGQINLLPEGGRIEKLWIVKDDKPWQRKGIDLTFFDPSRGFTGCRFDNW